MPTVLREALDLTEAQIDPENRVIRNVTLIKAGISSNRKHYPASVLQKAAPLFEGLRSYDSHLAGARKVGETTGWYANVRFENDRLIADRHFTRTAAGNDVFAIVEDMVNQRAPATLAGLSINAVGLAKAQRLADGADGLMVESITKAFSVDDVTTPAAGGTYLAASDDGDELATALVAAMTFEQFTEARPDFTERLRKELQTARQTTALTTAQAAAQERETKLAEAQRSIDDLTQRLEAANAELASARRALAISLILEQVNLPQVWVDELRKELQEAEPTEWVALGERYARLAKSAGYQPRVEVRGAGQQVFTPAQASKPVTPDQLVEQIDWDKYAATPGEQARLLEVIHRAKES